MIGTDTNVLLRLLVNDDPQQNELARDHLEYVTASEEVYVPIIVVAEVCWVLSRTYRLGNAAILDALRALIETENFVFQHVDVLVDLLQKDHMAGDISDHLISLMAFQAGCRHTITFDRAAARAVPGMELLS